MTSRTAGWMVAAALGGSLLTLLLSGQLHSSQVTYVRSAAAQRQVTVSRPAAARSRGVAVPAPAPAGAGEHQVPAPPGRTQVGYGSGQVSVSLPPGADTQAPAGPVQAVLPPGAYTQAPGAPVQAVLPPGAYTQAPGGPVQVVLPPGATRRQLRVLPRRTYIKAAPGPLHVVPPRAAFRRLRAFPPLPVCRIEAGQAAGTRIIGVRPGRRLVIVRGRPGARASLVPVPPRQVRIWVGPGRRVTVRGRPAPAGRRVTVLPAPRPGAPRPGSPRWLRHGVVIAGRHRITVGVIAPGGSWTSRSACFVSPARTRKR